MTTFKKIKGVKPIVKELLTSNKELRDSDEKLMAKIWELEIEQLKTMTAEEFLKEYSNKNLTSSESVTRARRKIQETDVSLRGNIYEKRHKEKIVITKEIKNL